MAEMLARYSALVFTGQRRLPENYGQLAREEGENATSFYSKSQSLKTLVDYPSFMMSVAEQIGCVPRWSMKPSHMVRHWFYPLWPIWFRKDGHGSCPEMFEKTMENFPFWQHGPSRDAILTLLPLAFCVLVQVPFDLLAHLLIVLGWRLRPSQDKGMWMLCSRRYLLHGASGSLHEIIGSFTLIPALVAAFFMARK